MAGTGGAAGQAPDEAWRSFETEHFRVTFPAELEALARRAGDRAERAWTELSARLPEPSGGRVDLVVTDHTDVSNGFATVFPTNRITVFARPPVDGTTGLEHFDDWMELVVTHELAHIFHLDYGGPLARLVRRVIGRNPGEWPTFPERSVPAWVIEGFATYWESALTGAGRVRGTFHEMTLRSAALEGRLEDASTASGEAPLWPDGSRRYVYGSMFFAYMVDRHGEEAMARFVEAVGGQWIPFRLNSAARDAFGVSFSEAWAEWMEDVRSRSRALAGDGVQGRTLHAGGRLALFAAVSPDGRRIAFSSSDGRSDSQIRAVELSGGSSQRLTRSNGVGPLAWMADGSLLFAQPDFVDPYRLRSDLYVWREGTGVRRLTRGARLDHPTPAPDGLTAIAVQDDSGRNRLVRVDLGSGLITPLASAEPEALWSYPALSPDGRWIAASRWLPGARYDIVLVDPESGQVAPVTADRALDVRPAWSADGRWLVWASDRSGVFQILAAEVDLDSGQTGPERQVTQSAIGVSHPTLDPSGQTLYVSAYHADGWHIEAYPFDPAAGTPPGPPVDRFVVQGFDAASRYDRRSEATVGPYRALRHLRPRHWEPDFESARTRPDLSGGSVQVFGRSFGGSTEGRDLVGRHAWSLSALFEPAGGRWQGVVAYGFDGFGVPQLSLSASQSHSVVGPVRGILADSSEVPLYLAERERALFLSATVPRRRVRSALAATVGGGVVRENLHWVEADLKRSRRFEVDRPRRTLLETSLSLSGSTARGFAFSVSRQEGLTALVRGRARWELDPSDDPTQAGVAGRDLRDLVARVSAYRGVPAFGHAPLVFAVRLAGGMGRGDGADAFHFGIGGASGRAEPVSGLALFGGRGLFFPVRGFSEGTLRGRSAWTASADLRFPLALVHAGVGLLPVHLDRLTGAVFVDAGNAWGPDRDARGNENPRGPAIASVGAEVLGRFEALWIDGLDLRLGVGVPISDGGLGRGASRARVYLRIGTAF